MPITQKVYKNASAEQIEVMEKRREFACSNIYPLAEDLCRFLSSACHQIEIAGSLRRRCNVVHDIDLVLWPICETVQTGQPDLFGETQGEELFPSELVDRLRRQNLINADNLDHYPRKLVISPLPEDQEPESYFDLITVELYLSEPDGSNFEALLQMRTGDAEFNRSLAARAKMIGLKYHAGYGIYAPDGAEGKRMDDGTEAGIFEALGIPWIEPKNRVGDFRTVLLRKETK